MQPEIKKIEEKTFYLYDYSNVLATRAKKIYSPYNIKTYGRVPSEDTFKDADFAEFKNGQYTIKRSILGNVRFEQQLEWLGFYNVRGGQLSKAGKGQEEKNGRHYKNDGIHQVREEKIKTGNETIIETKEVIVEKQQIPRIVAENMNVAQLKELATAWEIPLVENILELGDVDKIKESIISTMTQAGNIK